MFSSLKPLLQSIGVTRVADITGLDGLGIPVVQCIRPNAKHLSVSMGKGLTFEVATLSAIMEAMESYSLERPPRVLFYDSYARLKKESHDFISPHAFQSGFFEMVDCEEKKMEWIEACDCINQKKIYVPRILSNMDSTISHPEYGFFQVSTNGVAAGKNIIEARCHALYEIIERDCLFYWSSLSHDNREKTRLSLASIDDKWNQELIKKYCDANLYLKVWNITSRLNIPAFHCAVYEMDPFRVKGIARGTAAHLSKETALTKALLEAAQSRLGIISGARDDIFSNHYQQSIEMNDINRREGEKHFSSIESVSCDSLEKQEKKIIECLLQKGFDSIYEIHHTKPELMIPVIQVLIPGMYFNSERL